MEMDAIRANFGVAQGVLRSVKAGMDQVGISRSPYEVRAALKALREAVEDGSLPDGGVQAPRHNGGALRRPPQKLRPLGLVRAEGKIPGFPSKLGGQLLRQGQAAFHRKLLPRIF